MDPSTAIGPGRRTILNILRNQCGGGDVRPSGPRHANPAYAVIVQHNALLPSWRKQLIEWLFQVGRAFFLHSETIAHAVLLFDRVLSNMPVSREALQTVALTCACVASKLHESRPISAQHIRSYFHAICTVEAIRHSETNILACLKWDIGDFTAVDFINTVLSLLIADAALITAVKDSAKSLYYLAVLEYDFVGVSQSDMGLTVIAYACEMHQIATPSLFELLRNHGVLAQVDTAVAERLRSSYENLLPAPAAPPHPEPAPPAAEAARYEASTPHAQSTLSRSGASRPSAAASSHPHYQHMPAAAPAAVVPPPPQPISATSTYVDVAPRGRTVSTQATVGGARDDDDEAIDAVGNAGGRVGGHNPVDRALLHAPSPSTTELFTQSSQIPPSPTTSTALYGSDSLPDSAGRQTSSQGGASVSPGSAAEGAGGWAFHRAESATSNISMVEVAPLQRGGGGAGGGPPQLAQQHAGFPHGQHFAQPGARPPSPLPMLSAALSPHVPLHPSTSSSSSSAEMIEEC